MIEELFAEHFAALKRDMDQLLNDHGYGQMLVYSGGLKMQFADDLPYSFRVNPYFKMFVPDSSNPNCWVVWRVGKKPLLLHYQPKDFWHAVPELPQGFWVDFFEFCELQHPVEARQYFGDTQACVFLGEIDDQTADWNLGERNPDIIIAAIHWRRSYKSPYEQACILQANQIGSRGHQAAKDAFYTGASELEISLEFQRGCQQDEYRLAYPPVLGINEHASILHNLHRGTNHVDATNRRSLLIDAGADYLGYASDITRTYSFRDDEFGQLIQALDAGQQRLVQEIHPGQSYLDINTHSKYLCSSLLREFGLIKTTPQSAVETGLVGFFYPHGIGHFLGLQVHDVAGNYADQCGNLLPSQPEHKNLRMLRSTELAHVFTIEPGIYFIPILLEALAQSDLKADVNWQKIDRFLPFGGIRIEDNILMTDTGAINLTRQAFAGKRDKTSWQ